MNNILISLLITILGYVLLTYIKGSKENFWSVWNMPTRFTRNMSYNLRGDIPIIPYHPGPWLLSPLMTDNWYYRPIGGYEYGNNFFAENRARV